MVTLSVYLDYLVTQNELEKGTQYGNEPFQMKSKYSDIYVAVDKDRCHGIDRLTTDDATKDVDAILLDDAYQHRPVQPAVVDGDFRRRSGIQTVQQLRIGKEHLLLVLTACHKVVDVGELIGFGKAAAHLKNTVLPDAADGDHILYLAGHGVPLLVLFQQVFQRFDHDFPPSNLSLSAS